MYRPCCNVVEYANKHLRSSNMACSRAEHRRVSLETIGVRRVPGGAALRGVTDFMLSDKLASIVNRLVTDPRLMWQL